MNSNSDLVCFNRDTWKGWQIEGRPVPNRRVFAFTANSIAEVSKWKVDKGGGEVKDFAPAVRYAITMAVQFNAQTFFSKVSQDQVDAITTLIISRKSHMSLYAVTDAIESLMQGEEPCNLDTYGFDAKAILQALDRYWNRAKAEYYAWVEAGTVKERHDFKPGEKVPEYITEVRKAMEQKFGVVYDEEESKDLMRAAVERYKAEQGQDIDFS